MAKTHGIVGQVSAGNPLKAVGHTQSYSYNLQQEEAESYGLGDTWADNYSGIKRWSGSMVVELDGANAGQGELTLGAIVAVQLRPQGSGSGLPQVAGNIKITSKPVTVEKGAMTTQSFEFVGTGAADETAQT